jgi:hypothetical protein
LDVDLKSLVTPDVVENSSKRIAVRKVGAPVFAHWLADTFLKNVPY